MLKLLLILIIIFLTVSFFASYVMKKLRNAVSPEASDENLRRRNKEEVLYRKGDVTVMKGEAKKKKD